MDLCLYHLSACLLVLLALGLLQVNHASSFSPHWRLWYSPSHFILLPSILDLPESIHVLHSDELLIEVLAYELIIRTKAKDPLLLELSHEEFLHLVMCQLAIVVHAHRLHPTFIVLIKFQLMLNNLNSSLENTLILDSLSDLDLSSLSRALLVLRWLLVFHYLGLQWSLW